MKNRYSVEQIIRILGEIERGGLKVSDACRPHGISEQTYYRWRNKYGGMEVSEARVHCRLRGSCHSRRFSAASRAIQIGS